MVLERLKKFLFLGSMGAALSCSHGAGAAGETAVSELRVFYLPFSVETFRPVTVDTIERDARCVFSFKPSAQETKELRGDLGGLERGGFDNRRVRLKIVGLEDTAVFIDAIGGVRRRSANVGRLQPGNFKSLEVFIESVARREGCDPHS